MSKKEVIIKLDHLRYPQTYSINIRTENEALDDRIKDYLHVKAKYEAKYYRSKQTRRLP